ncbi:MAG TPA: DUF5937 family protein, partial [Stackebrandtia sp.]|uniref:ArsR/SmtB family transcription factor n=1 Tax=Stackebrandtia sp. TaxID=2023065 RepID=UPI002D5DFD00
AGLDLRPITLLQPRYGYTPDFLAPPPEGPDTTIDAELDRVAATPPHQVREEIDRALADAPAAGGTATARWLRGDPERVRDGLVELIRVAWDGLVAPVWPRVRALLDADVAFQSRHLAAGGLDRLFAELHPALSWKDNVLTRRRGDDEHRELRGEGLVLMPSAFKWDQVVVIVDAPWQPTVVYPARGLGALWQSDAGRTGEALTRLLGRTRAQLLAGLAEPASTTWLAHRFALSPGTVSGHLAILRDAGLAVGERRRHEIRYRRTPLGEALIGGTT